MNDKIVLAIGAAISVFIVFAVMRPILVDARQKDMVAYENSCKTFSSDFDELLPTGPSQNYISFRSAGETIARTGVSVSASGALTWTECGVYVTTVEVVSIQTD